MSDPKETDWLTIIERAAKHPVGMISMAHPATLRAMERRGLIYKSAADDWLLNDEAYEWLKEQQQQRKADKEKMREPIVEVSPQRAAFDSALRVLLIRENLDGAKWAIGQIRWVASVSDPETDRMLTELADKIEESLDKRTAELATKEH